MIATSGIYSRLVDRINTSVPVDQRIRAADRTKVFWALRRHSEMFPLNSEPLRVRILGVLALLALVAFAVVLLSCFGSVAGSSVQRHLTGLREFLVAE